MIAAQGAGVGNPPCLRRWVLDVMSAGSFTLPSKAACAGHPLQQAAERLQPGSAPVRRPRGAAAPREKATSS